MLLIPRLVITSGSTKGEKDQLGKWRYKDDSFAFSGKALHRYKYAVGHKAHTLRTITGVPLATRLSPANAHD